MKERGVVLIMVLIFMGLGGLIIAPTLSYASAALKFASVSREASAQHYADEAGLNLALWKLQYDTNFNCLETPIPFSDCVANNSYWELTSREESGMRKTHIEKVNSKEVVVRVEVPGNFLSVPVPSPTPISGACFYTWVERDKTWIQVGKSLTYTIHVVNCSLNFNANLRRLVFLLPSGFTYISDSSTGMTSLNPQVTTCSGLAVDGGGPGLYYGCLANDSSVLLDWPSGISSFQGPTAIVLAKDGGRVSQSFQVVPSRWGVFYVEPLVCYFAAAQLNQNFGPCIGTNGIRGGKQAPVVVGMFNIKSGRMIHSSKVDGEGSGLVSSQGR